MVLCVFWPRLFCSDFLFFTGAYKPPSLLLVNDVKIRSGDSLNRISMLRLLFIFFSAGRGQKFITTGNVAAVASPALFFKVAFYHFTLFSDAALQQREKGFLLPESLKIPKRGARISAWHLSWIWESDKRLMSDAAEQRNWDQTGEHLASAPATGLLWSRLASSKREPLNA